MKRINGSGCVRKLNGNRRKPYQAIITSHYSKGNQRFKNIGTFTTKEEAEYELYKYIHNIKSTNDINLKTLYEEWSNLHFKKLSKNSIIYYTNAYNKMKELHNKNVSQLKLVDLQKYCVKLSKSNQIAFKITVSQILDYAVANDYISKNYAKYLEITSKSKKSSRRIFTDEEIHRYIESDELYDKILKIMLYTGARISELLNLKIEDCNLQKGILCIKKAKTKSSIRKIPIHSKIKNIITFLCKSNKVYLIEKNGRKIEYGTFRRNFTKRYNHTSHETRHTFTTKCKLCNVDPLATKIILGHAVTDITYGTYTHVTLEYLKEEIEKIDY